MTLTSSDPHSFLRDGGELGRLIEALDWSQTSIGALDVWPQSLRVVVGTMLRSPVPLVLLWGDDGVMLYNGAYSVFAGGRHPALLGSKVREGWPEVAKFNDHVMRVGLAGGTLHFSDQELTLYRHGRPEQVWMNLDYSPVLDESGAPAGVLAIVIETTARRQAEEALRESEARQRLLLTLSDSARRLADPLEIVAATTKGLGEQLGATRVVYADIDETNDTAFAAGDWTDGTVPSLPERLRVSDYGPALLDPLRAGETLSVGDVRQVDELKGSSAALSAIQVSALVSVPLVKDGRLVANLNVHQSTPRAWTSADVELIEAVAERTWDALERARAEAALRASEERLSFLDRLATATMALADANAVLSTTTRLLGEHLKLSVCAYADMDEDQDGFTIRGDWAAPGSTSIVGHYRLADFGRLAVANLSAGLALVINDNLRELPPEEAATFQALGITATICMPLVKKGRLAALMAIHDRSPRVWTDAELTLLREVTGRSWAYVEQAAAAAELRESEARLRAVIDAAPVGLVFADAAGRITGANARVEEILGQPIIRSDGVERYRDDYVSYHADGRRVEAGEYPLARVIRRQVDRAELEVQLQRPDGQLRWVRYIATPIRDERGEVSGGVAASLDIDREKRFAEELAREVHTAVAEREEALSQLRQSQKLEAMGQLTGGVAHDFNNLLTPIIGSLDMLVRRGVGSERERRLIDGGLQAAERAKTLVQRLLAFARRQPLQPAAVDVGALIEGMAGLISSTLGPSIDLRLEPGADLPPAKADANQLEMALLNLAVNARDAMPNGGELIIAAQAVRADEADQPGLQPGLYLRLSVSDTGVGMDEATRERAIEPFFSTKGVGQGTGLGLSMAHGLAAQLGGGLTIESTPGQGTTIALWLPMLTSLEVAEAESRSKVAARVGRGTALLVDDDDLVRMSTADMLIDLGFEVVEAATAEAAIRLLKEREAPDLLITDHLMPGMNGVELARAARALLPRLPILIVSGYSEVEGVAPDLPRLSKPFRNVELGAKVAALLSESGAEPPGAAASPANP